jgi:ADP-heptose:LPS heptosyltransferase
LPALLLPAGLDILDGMSTATNPRTPFSFADIRRILVIKLRAVGDVVLASIVLDNIRRAFPDAHLDVLTENASAAIVRTHPAVSGTVVYDRKTMSGLDLIRTVRRNRYDLVIDLFGNPRTALVTRLSGARHRVGYRFRGRTYAYNHVVEPRGGSVHNTQFNLDALEHIGIPIVDRAVHLSPSAADRSYVDGFLTDAGLNGKTLVAINTGGGWYTKRWAIERFAALADRIAAGTGFAIVLPWGPGQKEEVEELQRVMRAHAFIPPPTTLMQLTALFERTAYVVSNDSGPMHIAAAAGSRVLGIFGPTRPELQGPYGEGNRTVRREGLACLGCNLTACTIGNLCMTELTVDAVHTAFQDLIQSPLPSVAHP